MQKIFVQLFGVVGLGLALISCNSGNGTQNSSNANEADKSDGYDLVWSDEFEYEGLPDSTKWSYDVGDGCPDLCGWGNNELQYYGDKRLANSRVENGKLIIEAQKESIGDREYSSARLLTRGKQAWKYGRIEVKAKLPSGRGTWPAIWMLPEDWAYGGWPSNGEIDIMEHVGHEPERVYATAHTEAYNHMNGTQDTDTLQIPDAETAFHEYAIEWSPEEIRWYVDDQHYSTFKNEHKTYKEWPFDRPFHLIFNIAVGGNWGGSEGIDDTIWPEQMQVEYVRVLQK